MGKNESGKTALLRALYRLNPINVEEGDFDETYDYPRLNWAKYRYEVKSGLREVAEVVEATYILGDDDIFEVRKFFGGDWPEVDNLELVLKKGYTNELTMSLDLDSDAAADRLVKGAELPT